MKNLCDLIDSFNDEEAELVVKHYLLKRNSYSKRLKLFNMIRLEGIHDDCIAAKRLYNKKPNAAFCQLKKRLKEDILNLLLVFNLQPENLNGYSEAEMQASKQIMQAKVLIKRGLNSAGMVLLKKAFKLAGEYEAFEVQTLAYEAIKNHSDGLTETSEMEGLEVQFSRNVDILYDLINLKIDHSKDSFLFREYEPHIVNTEHINWQRNTTILNEATKSARLKFQYTMKLSREFFNQKLYQKAREIAEEILPLLDHENQVLTQNQKGNYYFLFSKILMQLRFFEEAVFYAEKAGSYFGQNDVLNTKAYMLICRGNFYDQKFGNCLKYIEYLEHINQAAESPDLNTISLFKAWYTFRNNDYVASIKELNNCFKQSGRHSEVALNGKMLELMNLVEMKDYGWFDYKLDSFRKYLSNFRPMVNSSRYKLIYKLFGQLKKHQNKRLESNCENYSELIQMLSEQNKPYSWSPLGYELYPVHVWAESLVK